MKRNFRIATMAYLILLGITLGAVLFAGVVVAPVIFGSEEWLPGVMSHYQQGVLMTQNFVRLGYLVDATVLAIVLYEGYKYKMFERDTLTQIATFLAVATGLMFSHYYLPDILTMQMAGEAMTQTDAFVNTHKGSELDFKIFAAALLVLMVRNMQKACK